MNNHRLIIGASGSGKSTLAVRLVLDAMLSGASVIVVAPHHLRGQFNFGDECVKQALAYGRKKLIVDYLDRTDKVPQYTLLKRSSSSDYFTRKQENAVFGQPFYDSMAANRKRPDFLENPVLEKNAHTGIVALQSLDTWCPPYWVCNAFRKDSRERDYFLRNVTDDDVRKTLSAFADYDARKVETHLESGERMFAEILKSPMIQARTCLEPTIDYRPMLNEGYSFFFIGGMEAPGALRTFIRSQYQLWAAAAKEGLNRPLYIFWDEGNNYGFLAESESRGFSTLRAYGVSLNPILQSFDMDEKISNNIRQNANELWLRQGSQDMAMLAAQDCMGFLDAMKVHHEDTITKQVHAGFTEHKRVGKWKDADGRSGESENYINVPEYATVEERKPVYQSGNEQLLFNAQMFMELKVGEVIERPTVGKPVRYYVPPLEDPWVYPGLGDAKLEKFISWLLTTDHYRKPERREPPGANPTPTNRPQPRKGTTPKKGTTSRPKSSTS